MLDKIRARQSNPVASTSKSSKPKGYETDSDSSVERFKKELRPRIQHREDEKKYEEMSRAALNRSPPMPPTKTLDEFSPEKNFDLDFSDVLFQWNLAEAEQRKNERIRAKIKAEERDRYCSDQMDKMINRIAEECPNSFKLNLDKKEKEDKETSESDSVASSNGIDKELGFMDELLSEEEGIQRRAQLKRSRTSSKKRFNVDSDD